MENQEYTNPKLCSLLRMILWSQNELDKHNVKYPKMTDLANATIEQPKWNKYWKKNNMYRRDWSKWHYKSFFFVDFGNSEYKSRGLRYGVPQTELSDIRSQYRTS